MVPPPQLAARVVLPYSALGPVVAAVQENLENYKGRFGPPITLPPPPPNTPPPNIAELYEQMKISDDVAVGAYANTLMISHTAAEFCLDFILDLFPRPVVTSRIYLSAAHIPPWLETLKRTLAQMQARSGTAAAAGGGWGDQFGKVTRRRTTPRWRYRALFVKRDAEDAATHRVLRMHDCPEEPGASLRFRIRLGNRYQFLRHLDRLVAQRAVHLISMNLLRPTLLPPPPSSIIA